MTKILSLDGGGTWALIQTRALAALFPGWRGHEILSWYDFVFANSGGSLVLGGLMRDMSPVEIEAHFTDPKLRAGMYVRTPKVLSWFLRLFEAGSRYSTEAKEATLKQVFGPAPFISHQRPDGSFTKIVIIAYDYVRSRAFLFRSEPSPRFPTVGGVTIAAAVNASTTAPVLYYDRPAVAMVDLRYPGINRAPAQMQFWDGGVSGLNNPVAAAVSEALACGHAPGEIAALSIGTGTVTKSNNRAHTGNRDQLVAAKEDSAAIADLKKLAKAVVGDPPDFASYLAHTMTGGLGAANAVDAALPASRVVRMNPLVLGRFDAGAWVRPDWNDTTSGDQFGRLLTMDMDAAKDADVRDIEALTTAWLADEAWNQPVRGNFFQDGANGFHAEVGQTRFAAAATAARALGLVP